MKLVLLFLLSLLRRHSPVESAVTAKDTVLNVLESILRSSTPVHSGKCSAFTLQAALEAVNRGECYYISPETAAWHASEQQNLELAA